MLLNDHCIPEFLRSTREISECTEILINASSMKSVVLDLMVRCLFSLLIIPRSIEFDF